MSPPYVSIGLSVCRRCSPFVRAYPSPARYSSTVHGRSNPLEFASFFFHNAQWKSTASVTTTKYASPPQSRRSTRAAIEPVSLASYKPTEVLTTRRLFKIYTQLSKSQLTTLVVLTAMGGVALSPLPTTVPVLLATAFGTALCSASANSLNQLQEIPFDAQMARTRNRPLVRRAITPVHATCFATVTGISGPLLLWTMVNPTTAWLGILNIALYAGPYTWLKRSTIWNTWLGSIVGAIPPLMGWTACGGHLLPSPDHPITLFLPSFLTASPIDGLLIDNPLAPFALFMVLFSWQFPHFNALSHFVRESYAQAGYHMLCITNPLKNRLVAFRHALLFVPICSVLVPLSGLTTWAFALTSLVPNTILVQAAWKFYKTGSGKHARVLFQHSLWFLPVILGLMMFHKQGMDWLSWIGWRTEEDRNNIHPTVTPVPVPPTN
ncbi:protoheme IX farnesyltransferase [Irpex rosettiformis]|uniref:Protoheme IX farnesyltransferase n=1 Tax=Irpex rosettiformis TaxID=378272 RepID=A0ACB8TQ05_9APHY|nr:protoheme IX farnesyltransferase [Irpex rosettiformis]